MIISFFKNLRMGSFGKDASGGHWRPSESALREIVFFKSYVEGLTLRRAQGAVALVGTKSDPLSKRPGRPSRVTLAYTRLPLRP